MIYCPPAKASEAMSVMREMMGRLRLTVNEKKTRECQVPNEPFTFLGFTFGRQVSWRTGRAYTAPAPSKKNAQGVCKRIHEETSRSTTWRDIDDEVSRLNQILMGWGNYFRLGYVTGAWRVVQQHACRRLRWWLRRKHAQTRSNQGYPDMKLYEAYGLVNLTRSICRIPLWA